MRTSQGQRLAANLKWLFTELPFERRFDAAAEAGFGGVEYAAPYAYPARRLRRLLRDAGLHQVLINSPAGEPGSPERSGCACLPGHGAAFRDGIERGLEYAHELGSGLLHVLAGVRPPEVSRDRAFAEYVVNVGWAAERARGTGVRLVLEAQNARDVPGYFLESQAQAAAVARAVGAVGAGEGGEGGDGVGLLFDVYHAQIAEGDLVRTLRTHLPDVRHVQIADPPGRTEPGTGEIAWPLVFDTLREGGYSGWIGCEYGPAADTLSGLGWIASEAAR